MNIKDLTEEASGMGTSSIAVAPVGVGGMQKRNPDGTAKNALDQDNLLAGQTKKNKKKKSSESINTVSRSTKMSETKEKEKFKPHMMYDPKTGEGKKANKEQDHKDLAKKGWTHDKPKKSSIKEGLADLAQVAERDHEVQMARADLYKIAKYSIKLHEMLKAVSEQEGLEGWVQSKITKAADYMGSVYHHLDYDMKFAEEVVAEGKGTCDCDCGCGKEVCESCGKPHAKKDIKVKEGDGIYHDCAKSFKHQTYGECTVIPGEHTLFEDGTVTHYDATFTSCGQQYVVRNVPISKMTDIISENHSHMPVKKKKKK